MPTKIGINGFGRIGRLVMRAALENPNGKQTTGVGYLWHPAVGEPYPLYDSLLCLFLVFPCPYLEDLLLLYLASLLRKSNWWILWTNYSLQRILISLDTLTDMCILLHPYSDGCCRQRPFPYPRVCCVPVQA
jgi:hypothetical protein